MRGRIKDLYDRMSVAAKPVERKGPLPAANRCSESQADKHFYEIRAITMTRCDLPVRCLEITLYGPEVSGMKGKVFCDSQSPFPIRTVQVEAE